MTLAKKKILIITSSVFTLLAFLYFGITYTHYLNLKNVLIEKISHKATALFGQRVTIGDLSFGFSGMINLHDIVISNPEGFEPGHLLAMKRLSLDLRLQDLARGEFSFRSVEIRSPELSLKTRGKGIMNVSDDLKHFLSEKGTTKYLVDEFRIRSGKVSFNGEILATAGDVDLSLKNLSSRENARALVGGTLSYAGNPVQVDGWAYLNSADKKFSITVSSERFSLSSLKETLQKYGVDAGTLRAAFIVGIEGDMVKGCRVSSRTQLKTARSFAFYRNTNDIRLECDAFYDIPKSSLAVNDLSLHEGTVSLMHLKGTVADLGKRPSYAADVKIDTIDLSHFNFLKGTNIVGEVTSDAVRIRGDSDKLLSEASGVIRLRNGGIRSPEIHMEKADADITLSAGAGISVEALISAKFFSFGDYRAGIPIDASISLRAKGTPEKMAVMSGVHLSPVSLKLQEGGIILLEGLDASLEGTLSLGEAFTGRASVGMKGITFDDHKIPVVNAGLAVDYRKNLIAITDFRIDTEDVKTSAGRIDVMMNQQRSSWSVEVRNMNVLYPAKELRANNTDLVLHILRSKKGVSGDMAVSSGEVTFQGVPARITAGTLRFDEHDLSLSIPAAEIAGGRASLRAKGRSSNGFFPVEAEVTVEHIDLAILSRASQLSKLAYGASGTLKRAFFSGTIGSLVSLRGNIALETENISLMKKDNNKMVLKNIGVKGDAVCSGQDCAFRADMVAGNIRAVASGGITRFADKERVASMRVLMPETKLTDVRTSLWESVPDGLLYTGLNGYLSSDVALEYSGSGMKATGHVRVTDMLLQGENGEYSVGPINGIIPFLHDSAKRAENASGIASFEPSEFAKLSRYYSREFVEDGYQKITIGSLQYGFRILDSVSVWVKPEGNSLNIGRLSANMFEGKLNGSARLDFSDGLTYRAGILLEGLSLTRLCEEIEPVKGYISGKVDGIATIKGSGAGMAHLIGKADFWSYSSGGEKTKISKEFLQKMGGPSLKTYLGDRSFDKGVMSVYLQNGFVIFRELEISNRNILGVADLSVKVAPLNNRIEIDHLLWAMTEAAQRAKDKQEGSK